jgi:NADH-quinone oxidoreductase subunit C
MLPDALADRPTPNAIENWDDKVITGATLLAGEVTLALVPGRIQDTCRFLKQELGFVRLSSITAVDRYPAEPRFEIVYHLHSIGRNERIRLRCRLQSDSAEIDSVTGIWRTADWYEREIFDLFGVTFREHPRLKRILMPDDWDGHPLRKDFPVHGHKYSYQDE